MKVFLKIITIAILLLSPISCENLESIFIDCDNCYYKKPTETSISISLTNNSENPNVPVTVYEGNIDNGEIIYDAINLISLTVDVGKYYTVVAKYRKGGKVIYAVDGKKVRIKRDENSCDEPCYVIIGNEFNVRLK